MTIARAEVVIIVLALIRAITAYFQLKTRPGNLLPAGQVEPIITGSLVAALFCLALTLLSFSGRHPVTHAVTHGVSQWQLSRSCSQRSSCSRDNTGPTRRQASAACSWSYGRCRPPAGSPSCQGTGPPRRAIRIARWVFTPLDRRARSGRRPVCRPGNVRRERALRGRPGLLPDLVLAWFRCGRGGGEKLAHRTRHRLGVIERGQHARARDLRIPRPRHQRREPAAMRRRHDAVVRRPQHQRATPELPQCLGAGDERCLVDPPDWCGSRVFPLTAKVRA